MFYCVSAVAVTNMNKVWLSGSSNLSGPFLLLACQSAMVLLVCAVIKYCGWNFNGKQLVGSLSFNDIAQAVPLGGVSVLEKGVTLGALSVTPIPLFGALRRSGAVCTLIGQYLCISSDAPPSESKTSKQSFITRTTTLLALGLLVCGAGIAAHSYLEHCEDYRSAVWGVGMTLLSNAVSATTGVLVKRLGNASGDAPALLSSRVSSQLRLTAYDDALSVRPAVMPPRLVGPSERRHRRSRSAYTPRKSHFGLSLLAKRQPQPDSACSGAAAKPNREPLTIMLASSCVTGPAALLVALLSGELAQATQLEWTPRLVGTLFLSSAFGVCVMLGIFLTTLTYEPIVTAVAGNLKDIPLALLNVNSMQQSAGVITGTVINFSGSLLYVLANSGVLQPRPTPDPATLGELASTDEDDSSASDSSDKQVTTYTDETADAATAPCDNKPKAD